MGTAVVVSSQTSASVTILTDRHNVTWQTYLHKVVVSQRCLIQLQYHSRLYRWRIPRFLRAAAGAKLCASCPATHPTASHI